MPQLNLELDFLEHPKVMLLSEALGDWAEILPIRLWIFAAKFHSETGVIKGTAVNLIERHLKWRGKKGEGIETLVRYGFLDPVEDGYEVHDFLDHQGHIAAYKVRAKAASKARWGKVKDDATSILQASDKDAASNALTGCTKRAKLNGASLKAAAVDLAQQFRFQQRGGKQDEFKLTEEIESMLEFGYSPDAILAEIKKKPSERDYSERLFKLKARLEKEVPKQPSGPDYSDPETRKKILADEAAANARKTS